VSAGTLQLVAQVMPGALRSDGSILVNSVAVVLGLVIRWLPWSRWRPSATLALVPAAFGLVLAGQWFNPDSGTLYGLWFVVVFGWVGAWHPPRTGLLMAPLGAAAYIVPFLPWSPAASSEALATVVIAVPIAVVLAEVLAHKSDAMVHAHRALEATAELLERANLTDDLTGLGNRRLANSLLDAMAPGDGLILLDLDHFKVVNDTLGHAEGDRVLMELGAYLQDAVREHDSVARFGGEEFLILARGVDRGLPGVVQRLLQGWRDCSTDVTLSAGAVVHRDGRGPTETLEAADQLLYQAKANGRDRAVWEVAGAGRRSRPARGAATATVAADPAGGAGGGRS